MKRFVFLLLLLIIPLHVATQAYADSKLAHDVVVNVKGLVCDFCAQSLEKIFKRTEVVKSIAVDMDKKTVSIDFVKDKQLSNEKIQQLIIDAGYNVEGLQRREGA